MINIKNKSAQVTIFIILGILIVAGIILYFVLSGNFSVTSGPSENPKAYMQKCVTDSVIASQDAILQANGFPARNLTNYILYNKEKIPYLCSVSMFYIACVPQEPALLNKIQTTMEDKVAIDTESCWQSLKQDYSRKGYSAEENDSGINLSIERGFVQVSLNKVLYLTKDQDSIQLKDLVFQQPSPMFGLIDLEQTIVNYESTYCGFDALKWMQSENTILISTTRTSDQTKVYTIKDRETQKQIKFAIKTCVLPAGI